MQVMDVWNRAQMTSILSVVQVTIVTLARRLRLHLFTVKLSMQLQA
jgi:hypothetical protein